jgi:hypothetical protein
MNGLLQIMVYFVGVFVIAVPLCLIAYISMLMNADWLALKLFMLALAVFKKVCVFAKCNDKVLNKIDEIMTKIKVMLS